ncbi:MAG TPA: sigma-70 family RNA polymerase sigma factor [Polyangiaceae bacterium]|jgi:RNA polymerase sigma-70 factor (ECF subfamily)
MLSLAADPKLETSAHDAAPSFRAIYDQYFAFVWRMLWRLGVAPESVADAAQDAFVVVHRRLDDLHGASVARSWLYGIVVRVAHDYRRVQQRRVLRHAPTTDELRDPAPNALEQCERREAASLLDHLLGELSDERREVLVLVELEQLSVPEVADLLGQNPNTLYTRLRSARSDFERALGRHRAQERRHP